MRDQANCLCGAAASLKTILFPQASACLFIVKVTSYLVDIT